MASRVTPLAKEEEVQVEGTTEAAGSIVSIHGRSVEAGPHSSEQNCRLWHP